MFVLTQACFREDEVGAEDRCLRKMDLRLCDRRERVVIGQRRCVAASRRPPETQEFS